MSRLLRFLGLVLVLVLLMYSTWYLSAPLLPEGLNDVARRRFWFGFFYLCSGTAKSRSLTGHME